MSLNRKDMNIYRENKGYTSESSDEESRHEESRDEVWFSKIFREKYREAFGFNLVKVTTSVSKIAQLNFEIESLINYPTVIKCVGHAAYGLVASQFHSAWMKSNLLHFEIFKAKNKNGFLFYSDSDCCLTYRFYLTTGDALWVIDSIPELIKSYEKKLFENRRNSSRFEKPASVECVAYMNEMKNQYVKIFGTNYRDIMIMYNYNATPETYSTCFLTLDSMLALCHKKPEILEFDRLCLSNRLQKSISFSYSKLNSLSN